MIVRVSIEDFMGKTRVYEFGPGVNVLRGPNEIGKSTLRHAINFALFGVDASGVKNPEHLISVGKDTMSVALQTEKATFIRKKKRGQAPTLKLSRDNLPQTTLSQQDLTKALGMSFEAFASAYDVGFFMQLPKAKKLEVLSEIARLDRKALFAKLYDGPVPDYVKLVKPRIEADYCADNRRKMQNTVQNLTGNLTEVSTELDKIDKDAGQELQQTPAYDLGALKARIELFTMYERDLRDYNNSTAAYNDAMKKYQQGLADKRRLELELQALGARPEYDDAKYSKRYDELVRVDLDCQKEFKVEPVPPKFPDAMGSGETCTRCGQVVSEKTAASMAAERETAINDFNKLAREVADYNKNVKNKQVAAVEERQRVYDERKTKKTALENWDKKAASLRQQIDRITASEPKPPKTPAPPEGYSVEALAETKKQYDAALMAEGKKTYLSGKKPELVFRRDSLQTEITKLEGQIQTLTAVEKALLDLPEFEVMEMLRTFEIPGYKSLLVDDGDYMIFDAIDCPYPSMSDGKKLKCGRELCVKFQSLMTKPPKFYFWDNSDLVDRVVAPPGVQVFLAEVDDKLTELQIIQM